MLRLLLLVLSFGWALPLAAASTPWQKLDHSEVRLIAGAVPGEGFKGVLQIRLDAGWKTYWRHSGDSGVPVMLADAGSTNLAGFEMRWPAPLRSVDFGTLLSYGYKHAVDFPLTFTPQNAEQKLELKLKLRYAVCKELCIMVEQPLKLSLSAATLLSQEEQVLLKEAQARVPAAIASQADIQITHAPALSPEGVELRFTATSQRGFEKPDVAIEAGPQFRFQEVDVSLHDGNTRADFVVSAEKVEEGNLPLAGRVVTLTLMDRGGGVEWQGALLTDAGMPYDFSTLLLMLAFAVLGGFILNAMPCVLPVLSLKLLGVAKKSGKEAREIRFGFLASAAGILASFVLLALLVIALKASGQSIGWGFQFQEPYFLIVLAIILTLFAANLFGFFEVQLPQWLNEKSQKLLHGKSGYADHFLTGVLATLLATPCSAPFLGTAIGFAFSQGALETLLLFVAMGVGLALPYLLFAAFPHWVARLPKPGAWMLKVKAALGALLVLTAIWILWVLAGQEGLKVSLGIGALLLALLACLKFLPRQRQTAAAVLILGCLIAPPFLMQAPTEQAADALWQPFSEDMLKGHLAAGKTVFVDVTADWCLTCKANKLLVLDRPEIVAALSAPNVVALKGDWTQRSADIAAYLQQFGRYGIPFNAVYGPSLPQGEALPELLNREVVLQTLEKASRKQKEAVQNDRPAELP